MINDTIDETAKMTTQETTQEKILNLIKNNPEITQTQMAEVLRLIRDGISYNIKQLKENDVIDRRGPTKKGKWIIKKERK